MTDDTANSDGLMRIGDLSARTGVSRRSLRYYEEQDMLAATRTPSGQRLYGEAAVERVRRIQVMFAAGLSSRTIAELLPCVNDADGTPSDLATDLLVSELQAERARLDVCVADLGRAQVALDAVIAAATRLDAPGHDGEYPARSVHVS